MKGHYIGSYEDLYMLHCQKVEEMKNEVLHFSRVYQICESEHLFSTVVYSLTIYICLTCSNNIKLTTKT